MTQVYGHGVTTCGFCGGLVVVLIQSALPSALVAGENFYLSSPVFCDSVCEHASAMRLDERVNA